ncbi:MAG TPA: DNA repair protein RecN [Clostridiales bacterium]|nr:MAG: DNA repair protein RecN [Clostridiales bacterium GWD2_32_19]HCC08318.1 DNA repair protein RecN [Clostridiales bacterium]
MLSYINIKNMGLIEELSLELNDGLNILTGETGVGKSIIINSINFGLGGRVNKDLIRQGCEFGYVELMFQVKESMASEIETLFNIKIENNELLVSRKIIDSGKNICKVNGETTTTSMLQSMTDYLIDIHGQHEHQSLMNAKKHINILDQFCERDLIGLKEILGKHCEKYNVIKKQLNLLIGNDTDRERKIDLIKYQIDEISAAKLLENEEEELNEKRKILGSSEKLMNGIGKVYKILYDEPSIIDQTGKCVSELEYLGSIDETIKEYHTMLKEAYIQMEEVASSVREYSENIEHSPESINKVERRLDIIYSLKRKYGSSIAEILSYSDEIQAELDFIAGSEENIAKLKQEQIKIEEEIQDLCEQISCIRKQSATNIKEKIEQILNDLEMKNVRFEPDFKRKQNFDKNGYDEVEFLFSANKGEKVKQLDKIASGGEMSRVMLAIKTVLADTDNIETLIFDEIDTGISGYTAQKVAEKMALLSKKHQLICITHLPQIAAMADYHYNINKNSENDKTVTNVKLLNENDIINELARLITGAETTEITIKHAEEMKEQASRVKQSLN